MIMDVSSPIVLVRRAHPIACKPFQFFHSPSQEILSIIYKIINNRLLLSSFEVKFRIAAYTGCQLTNLKKVLK